MSENSAFGDCMHDLLACDSSFNFFLMLKLYASTEVMSPFWFNFFLMNQFLFFWLVFKAVEWLSELLDALLKTHIRLGDDAQETKVLLEKHRKFVDVAQVKCVILLAIWALCSFISSPKQNQYLNGQSLNSYH